MKALARRWWPPLALGLAIVGALVGVAVLVLYSDDITRGGAGGRDAWAYWLAGRHLLEGSAVYGPVELRSAGTFWYPPPLALLAAPLGLLPWPAVRWGFLGIELLALRWLAGSWRWAGIALLFPPVLIELNMANVAILGAAMVSAAIRGASWLLPLAALPKLTPLLVAVALGRRWRPLLASTAAILAFCAISVVLRPELWEGWLAQLRFAQAREPLDNQVLRFGLAALVVVGVLVFRPRYGAALVFTAHILALPALYPSSPSGLVGVPRLLGVPTESFLTPLPPVRRRLAPTADVPGSGA